MVKRTDHRGRGGYHWYKDVVIAGAIQHHLPDEYVTQICAVDSKEAVQESYVRLVRPIPLRDGGRHPIVRLGQVKGYSLMATSSRELP
jgi:hypothetical protein